MPLRLDSHQHFWRYSPTEHVWMNEKMDALRRDFLPENLQSLLAQSGFDGTIAVQAHQNIEETRWLLELAREHAFIRGVVGWVDLRSAELPAQLARFGRDPKLVGVRHVVHDEPDDWFMLTPPFLHGLSLLAEYSLTYDLLLFPRHMPVAAEVVRQFPAQPFVLDHIAKPPIAAGQVEPWRRDLQALAQYETVSCKLSGLVTEARWQDWRREDFHRYLDIVLDAFGPARVMIGSDWPVCTLSGSYAQTMDIVVDYVRQFSPAVQADILGGNCARIYGLEATSSPAT
jgi:L-fuconolactonase